MNRDVHVSVYHGKTLTSRLPFHFASVKAGELRARKTSTSAESTGTTCEIQKSLIRRRKSNAFEFSMPMACRFPRLCLQNYIKDGKEKERERQLENLENLTSIIFGSR